MSWIRNAIVAFIPAAAASFVIGPAHANVYNFTASGLSNGLPANAQATVTVNAGSVVVVMTDLTTDPNTSAQAVSGFIIAFHDAVGTISFNTATGQTVSGGQGNQLINLSNSGNVTPVAGNPTHWSLGSSTIAGTTGTNVNLQTRSGGPKNLIVGNAASYPHINNGFNNFDPYIQGTATFTLTDALLTANEAIDAFSVEFGTQPELVQAATQVITTVAEPQSIALLVTGLLGLAAIRRFRRA